MSGVAACSHKYISNCTSLALSGLYSAQNEKYQNKHCQSTVVHDIII